MDKEIGKIQVIAGIEVLNVDQVCAYLGISRSRLYTIRNTDKTLPKPFSFTDERGGLRWKLEELKSWALEKMESSSEEE